MPAGVYVRSDEARKNMSLSAKGRIPWNKGVHIFCGGKKFEKGNIPWCKGKRRPDITGEKNPMWKGGRNKTMQGYIEARCPSHPHANKGRILEHRLVVEKLIGRYLSPKEQVHHLGDKSDNRPHMLMAFIDCNSHSKFEHKISIKKECIIFDGRKLKKEANYGKEK